MFTSLVKPLRKRILEFSGTPDAFLRHSKGVIHVGANTGQERALYDLFDLEVLWIEPLAQAFTELEANIAVYPRQRALKALVTDQDDREYEFHITSNAGESSSIFALKDHRDIWPDVTVERTEKLRSTRLSTLLASAAIDPTSFDTLVMDTQGSELLVLKGAGDLLRSLRFIKTEAADFEAYDGCCTVDDLRGYLEPIGFREIGRTRFAERTGGGAYYNLIFRRSD